MPSVRILREHLTQADLTVDAVYEGGRAGNVGDDPLGPLLGVSNQGGFRHLGRREKPALLVITSSMSEPDWPDHLDLETGLFTYYGDNRSPGCDLHGTPRWGNQMLRDLFARAHAAPPDRASVAPILVFRNAGTFRDVVFLGLAVPGAAGLPPTEDLIAVWRSSGGQRFQNYKATFTILDTPEIDRAWLRDVRSGTPLTSNAPRQWQIWVNGGQPSPLKCVPNTRHRTKTEQLPTQEADIQMLERVYSRFEEDPFEFEECAVQIAEMLLPDIVSRDLTQRSRDGGRDAVGTYRIGSDANGILVTFALEAKCYQRDSGVGVKETSRLISRLRHRQFGLLVTTSYLHSQAYQEIIEDQHPILVVSGKDIIEILKKSGIRDQNAVEAWLDSRFGPPS